jgi:MFS family permease
MNPELARLIAGQICLHACMTGMRMAGPLLALREGHTELAVGMLLAMFALTQVFLALPAGRYADRHGLKRPVGWSVLVGSLGTGLAVLWPTFPMLCISALLTGGASGAAVIALQRHVGRRASGMTELKQAFSWLAIGPAISNFIGPFFAGLLIDHAGFRSAFFMLAMLPLLAWWWVRQVHELPALVVDPEQPRRSAWDLLKLPMFRRMLWINWVMASCWDVHTFVVPLMGHEQNLSASAIGSILGGFAIAAALIRVALPGLVHRVHEWQVISGSMVITGILLVAYPFGKGAWAMGACSVLLGFSLGVIQPMLMSMLHQITPHQRHGEAIGLRLMAINASSVAMPMLFGVAGAFLGSAGVFWSVAAWVVVSTRTALRLKIGGAD